MIWWFHELRQGSQREYWHKKVFFFVKSVWKCIYIHYHAESSIYKMKCHVEEMLRAQQFCP